MTDRPIIFSAPMVRALLDGRKTQTRRVLKPQPSKPWGSAFQNGNRWWTGDSLTGDVIETWKLRYAPGDRLYVRENWQGLSFGDYQPTKSRICDVRFAATDTLGDAGKDVRGYPWRPSIHMPRWASRLTLVVTDVRVQRLKEISEADAVAEGIERLAGSKGPNHFTREITGKWSGSFNAPTAQEVFADLWNDINGPEAWVANPWVVAVSFTVHRCNIDKMEARNDH